MKTKRMAAKVVAGAAVVGALFMTMSVPAQAKKIDDTGWDIAKPTSVVDDTGWD